MIRACWACWACQWFNKLKSSKSSTRIPKIMIQVIIVLSITGFILSHAFAADNLSYQVNTITLHGVHPYYLAMHSLGEKALIVDSSNAAIYLVSTTDDSSIELFAGQPGEHGWRDGQRITGNISSAALLHSPTSICLDPISGNIFFLDRGPAESNASSAVATVLRMIDANTGWVRTILGSTNESGTRDGIGSEALLSSGSQSLHCMPRGDLV